MDFCLSHMIRAYNVNKLRIFRSLCGGLSQHYAEGFVVVFFPVVFDPAWRRQQQNSVIN